MSATKTPRCLACGSGESKLTLFGVLAETGQRDPLCVTCRFNQIDGKWSSTAGIRRDMRRHDVPTHGPYNSPKLRFGSDELDESDTDLLDQG